MFTWFRHLRAKVQQRQQEAAWRTAIAQADALVQRHKHPQTVFPDTLAETRAADPVTLPGQDLTTQEVKRLREAGAL